MTDVPSADPLGERRAARSLTKEIHFFLYSQRSRASRLGSNTQTFYGPYV